MRDSLVDPLFYPFVDSTHQQDHASSFLSSLSIGLFVNFNNQLADRNCVIGPYELHENPDTYEPVRERLTYDDYTLFSLSPSFSPLLSLCRYSGKTAYMYIEYSLKLRDFCQAGQSDNPETILR